MNLLHIATSLESNELSITAPLPMGKGTQDEALAFETQCLVDYQPFISLMQRERVSSARRAVIC